MIWARELPYFSASELACKGTGVIKMNLRFAAELPALRAAWGRVMLPTSVCRTPEHNAAVGGHPTSMHLTDNPKWQTEGCMAADISWRDWSADKKLRFARLAYSRGWSVGLHDGFCHIDRRADLNLAALPQVVFLYGEWDDHFAKGDVM